MSVFIDCKINRTYSLETIAKILMVIIGHPHENIQNITVPLFNIENHNYSAIPKKNCAIVSEELSSGKWSDVFIQLPLLSGGIKSFGFIQNNDDLPVYFEFSPLSTPLNCAIAKELITALGGILFFQDYSDATTDDHSISTKDSLYLNTQSLTEFYSNINPLSVKAIKNVTKYCEYEDNQDGLEFIEQDIPIITAFSEKKILSDIFKKNTTRTNQPKL